MSSKSFFIKALSFCLFLGLMSACSSSQDGESESAGAQEDAEEITRAAQIELSEVSSGECLNIETYFNALQAMPAGTQARKLTTTFKVRTTGSSLPRNFYLRLAAGNFQIWDGPLNELPDLMKVVQSGCESVTISDEGHSEIYEIKEAKKEYLVLENEWNSQVVIRWKDPVTMETTSTSTVGDYLCSSSSRAKSTVAFEITWGSSSIFSETIDKKRIDPAYLALVSEATGFAFNSLYTDFAPPAFTPEPLPPPPFPENPSPDEEEPPPPSEEPPSEEGNLGLMSSLEDEVQPVAPSDSALVVMKLKELQSAPIRPDLMMCY